MNSRVDFGIDLEINVQLGYDTIRYDGKYFACAEKWADSHL